MAQTSAKPRGRLFIYLKRIGYICLAIVGIGIALLSYIALGNREGKHRAEMALRDFSAYCVLTTAMPPQLMMSYATSRHLMRLPPEAEKAELKGALGYAWYIPPDNAADDKSSLPLILISRVPATCTIATDGIDPIWAHSIFGNIAKNAFSSTNSTLGANKVTFERLADSYFQQNGISGRVTAYFIGETGKEEGFSLISLTSTSTAGSSLRYTFARSRRPDSSSQPPQGTSDKAPDPVPAEKGL